MHLKLRLTITSEINRFGFSDMLSRLYLSPRQLLPPRGAWISGWKWYDICDKRLVGVRRHSELGRTIVVANEKEASALRSLGFSRILKGGLPFAYALALPLTIDLDLPKDRDTLVILPKSQDTDHPRNSAASLISYVADDVELRARAVFCIFFNDQTNYALRSLIAKTGVPTVMGADPHGFLDLIRIKTIFKSFERVVTNTVGSHLPYAAALGSKIKIVDPFDDRDREFLCRRFASYKLDDAFINYLVEIHSKKYFFNRYSAYFRLDNFSNDLQQWGLNEIGYSNLLGNKDLENLLGLSIRGKIRRLEEAITSRLLDLFHD